MRNLTKGGRVFKIILGILIIMLLYLPEKLKLWVSWIIISILVITSSTRYCPICKIVDKRPKKTLMKGKLIGNLSKGQVLIRILVGIYIVLVLYALGTVKVLLSWILASLLIISGIIGYCPLCDKFDKK